MATKARYPRAILDLMAEKTARLSKAEALTAMGLPETAHDMWLMMPNLPLSRSARTD